MTALLGLGRRLYKTRAFAGLKRAYANFDADLSELLLQELNDLGGRRMVVARPKFHLKAVRVARFFKKRLGLLRVIGPGTELNGIVNRERRNAFGHIGVSGKGHLDERLFVHGVVKRLTNADILEDGLREIHFHKAKHDRRRDVDAERAFVLHHFDLLGRQRKRIIGFPRERHGHARAVFHHRTPGDGIELRVSRAPVVRVLLHPQNVARVVVLHDKRPGAARMEGNADFLFAEALRADHDSRRMRKTVDEGRIRTLEREADRVRIKHLE